MAEVSIENGELVIGIPGWDRVFALKSELRVPLSHIKNVSLDPEEAHSWWHGLRVGVNLPGVIVAGTFYTRDGRIFYDVHDPNMTVAFELEHDSYKKVIVQVDDPAKVADQIRAALPT
jgi:hypothetical protein